MLHDVKHENEQKLEIELHQASNKRGLKEYGTVRIIFMSREKYKDSHPFSRSFQVLFTPKK